MVGWWKKEAGTMWITAANEFSACQGGKVQPMHNQ